MSVKCTMPGAMYFTDLTSHEVIDSSPMGKFDSLHLFAVPIKTYGSYRVVCGPFSCLGSKFIIVLIPNPTPTFLEASQSYVKFNPIVGHSMNKLLCMTVNVLNKRKFSAKILLTIQITSPELNSQI